MSSELFKLAVVTMLRQVSTAELHKYLLAYEQQLSGIRDIVLAIKQELETRERGAT